MDFTRRYPVESRTRVEVTTTRGRRLTAADEVIE